MMNTDEPKPASVDVNTQPIDYMTEVIQFIPEGEIVPIISNSFRLEEIFGDDQELIEQMKVTTVFYDKARTMDQQLTRKWAEKIEYPMSDSYNLARVAQYRQVDLEDSGQAKMEYLKMLNDRLLKNNEGRSGVEDVVKMFQKASPASRLIFSEVVKKLELPSFPDGKEDPLRLLARLPLTTYITTSYFSFIEEALRAEEKNPRTQVWSWSGGKSNMKPEHLPDRNFVPDPKNPAVYHLFGLENYPKTLVMSEDDYMNFLMNSAVEIGRQEDIPSSLMSALSESRLLLLGYHLRDWDFRALFRFILKFREREGVDPSIALQLMPSLENKAIADKSLVYLDKYFGKYNFKVKWINTEKFIYELMDTWAKNAEGQP